MKKIVFAISCIALFSCNKSKFATMEFEEKEFDFGTIKQGQTVTHDFKFTNTGSEDLKIIDAKGSCGCTIPEYPHDAIKPDGEGVIKVSFNSTGKSGEQQKTVVISANTETGNEQIEIKAKIEN
jgi:hypothetical protein